MIILIFPGTLYNECVDFIIKDLMLQDGMLPTDYDNRKPRKGYTGCMQGIAFTRIACRQQTEQPENDLANGRLLPAAKSVMDMN